MVETAAPSDLCASGVKEPCRHKSGSPKVSAGEGKSILWVSEMFLAAELLGAIFGEEENIPQQRKMKHQTQNHAALGSRWRQISAGRALAGDFAGNIQNPRGILEAIRTDAARPLIRPFHFYYRGPSAKRCGSTQACSRDVSAFGIRILRSRGLVPLLIWRIIDSTETARCRQQIPM